MYKLIRNKYKDIIPHNKLSVVSPTESPIQYKKFLIDKIHEELDELAETDYTDIDEFADIYEVFLNIMKMQGITEQEVREARLKKLKLRGSFSDGLLLQY